MKTYPPVKIFKEHMICGIFTKYTDTQFIFWKLVNLGIATHQIKYATV